MNALGIACAVIGGWLILAAMGATIPYRVRRATPPAAPAEDDRTWLADQPKDVLVGAELDGQFYGIVAREWYL